MSTERQVVALGSAGFLGSSIAQNALGIDLNPSAHTDWVTTVEAISRQDWETRVPAESTVVFAIGRPDVRGSLLDPLGDHQSYIAPLHHLIGMLHRGEHLVLISSAAVYSGQQCPADGFGEASQLGSASVYGWHRILAEHILRERAARANGEWTYSILRPFSVFGCRLRQQVVHDLTLRILASKGLPIAIRGTGEETRDFIHVDALPAVLEPLRSPSAPRIVNLCTGTKTTIRSLAERIRELLGESCTFEFDNETSPPIHLAGNADRTGDLIAVKSFGLDQKLQTVVEAYSSGTG